MVNWKNILYTLVNITGLQFFGREDPAVEEFFEPNLLEVSPPLKTNEQSLRAGAALVYDSVYFFARALSKFIEQHPFNITSLVCDAQQPWTHGSAFALFLKTVEKEMRGTARENSFATSLKRMESLERSSSMKMVFERMFHSKLLI